MKNSLWLCFLISIFSTFGCIPTVKTKPVRAAPPPEKPTIPPIFFKGKTNADLLSDSIMALDLAAIDNVLPRSIQKDNPILIGSLEIPADSERSTFPVMETDKLLTFMEDGLTSKLASEGYLLVERDMDILTRIYHETGPSYLISLFPDYKQSEILEELKMYMKDKKNLDNSNNLANRIFSTFFPYFEYTNLPFVRYPFNGDKTLQETHTIDSAAYVLSFRVLDCGITYFPVEEKLDGIHKQVERVAVTKLHLRLTDAKEGLTHWAGIVVGRAAEKTPTEALPYAESPNLRFFGFNNPVEEFSKNVAETSQMKTLNQAMPDAGPGTSSKMDKAEQATGIVGKGVDLIKKLKGN